MGGRARQAVAATVIGAALLLGSASEAPAINANSTSTTYAGYRSDTGGTFTSGTGKVVVPAMTCPATGHVETQVQISWLGIDLSSTNGATARLWLTMSCTGGKPFVSAGIQETDAEGSMERFLAVAAGNTLSVSFTYNPGTGAISASGRDVTTDQRVHVFGHTANLMWVHAEDDFALLGGALPLPTFANIHFSGLTLDGGPASTKLSAAGNNLVNNSNGHTLIRAGAFSASGTAFTDVFIRSS